MDGHEGNQAMDALAGHLKRLNKVIKEIQELNIDTTLSSLPKYAVVGDQSAGKSSIVQALCGIALPRSPGTTTRCPFLITTHKDASATGTWTCEISIKNQDNHDGNLEEQDDANKPQILHFATTTNTKELEDILRRAQLAILNPGDDPKDYVSKALDEIPDPAEDFSKNVICLDIKGPDLPELMFYDLPGCINVYDMPKDVNGDTPQRQCNGKDVINMITSTVTDYIKDEQCLLLLACSADQDVENSLMLRYIREHNAEDRCIGVFTKADLVTPTRSKNVQDIVKGLRYQLGMGWFVTKQLSQQDIDDGMSFDEATKRESELFATTVWNEFPSLRQRYGMPNLQKKIASSLRSHIVSGYA
jgi:GTP-binding protein EngB required for normal cell division